MRVIIFNLLFIIASISLADPHYVQALHPFMGDKQYQEYLESFNEPFSVVTDSVDLDWDSGRTGKMYIYIYRINQHNIGNFTLDISCPGNKTSNIDSMPDNAVIDQNNNLSWSLDPKEKKKVEIIYSTDSPVQRNYYLNNNKEQKQSTLGPSCK